MNRISPNWFDLSTLRRIRAWDDGGLSRLPPTRDVKPIRRNSRGYLLLEVLLALVVLSIIVGLVFRIIQTTSTVTSNVQFLQGQQEHSDGIYELLRKDIESLPSTAEFQTKRTKDEFQLIFDQTPFNFSWKGAESGFGTVILAVRSQPDGGFSLVATELPEPSVTDPQSKPPPPTVTTLITGLVRCNWRFFDRNTGNWVAAWTNGGDKPTLLECTFQVSGQPASVRAVFPWRVAQTLPGNS
ncbi:MAG: prepilin-type N-terminal cleavage/methylation domain-containing protein [Verrucomicrobia bacterium]|nr:prepilin-type N-terminal cleavage/methylation domain-containing protein [Verrucomicrobiota bacterium]